MDPIDTKTANRLATGAPGSLTLAGRVYLVTQPTRADFVTLRKHLLATWKPQQTSPLAAIAPELAALPLELQKVAVAEAVKLKDARKEPTAAEAEELLLSPPGVAFWAWLLVRKLQPEVTLAELQAAITLENVDQVIAELMTANGLEEANPN